MIILNRTAASDISLAATSLINQTRKFGLRIRVDQLNETMQLGSHRLISQQNVRALQ
jgi:hypothetical protein